MKFKILYALLIVTSLCLPQIAHTGTGNDKMPDSFVDIQKIIPEVILDIRYYGQHNFLGERVDGYMAPKCFLTKEAAEALAGVQKDLEPYSLTLKIYDCYRPQRAVDHFVRWAKEIENTKTMKEFYPTIDKRNLFKDGYIDSKSGHSRGSTVDLTIVPLPAPKQPTTFPDKNYPNVICPRQNALGITALIWEPALIVFMNYRIRQI